MNDSLPYALTTFGVAAGITAFARVRAAPTLEQRLQAVGFHLNIAAVALLLTFAGILLHAASAPRLAGGGTPDLAELRKWAELSTQYTRNMLAVVAALALQLALFVGMVAPPIRSLASFVMQHDADLRGRDQAALAKRG